MTPRLRALVAISGVVLVQEGDAEAAGDARVKALAAVLAVLRPYRHARRAELAGRKPPTATVYPRCAPGLGAPERGMDAAKANQVHKNMKQWTETRHRGRAEDSHKVDQSG